MKQLTLFLVFCLFTNVCLAQIGSGTIVIGSSAGFNEQQTNTTFKASSISIKPNAGYYFNTNWMLGINSELRFSNSETKNNLGSNYQSTYKSNSKAISLGPVVRYNYPVGNRFYLFGEASAGYTTIKDKISMDIKEHYTNPYTYITGSKLSLETEQLYMGVAPGIVFFPVTRLGVELKSNLLSYTHTMKQSEESQNSMYSENNFNLNMSFGTTSLGIGYYF